MFTAMYDFQTGHSLSYDSDKAVGTLQLLDANGDVLDNLYLGNVEELKRFLTVIELLMNQG